MSKSTIEAIRKAESDAAAIRAEAVEREKQLKTEAKTRGEALLLDTEKKTRAEIDAKFVALREKTDRLIEKNRADALAETENTKKAAHLRMHPAVNEILRGLDRQCQ